MDTTSDAAATPAEGEWHDLFDGTNLRHWRGYRRDEVPDDWQITGDGALYFDGEGGDTTGQDLITRETYGDFELRLEWKLAPGSNSGILYRVSEEFENAYDTGPEFQLIDGSTHEDLDDTQRTGANYALVAPDPALNPPVETWHSLRLVADGPEVQHWINDTKVVEYVLWSREWQGWIDSSKFSEWEGYGMNRAGHICLQDHGCPVWFRDIEIRTLR